MSGDEEREPADFIKTGIDSLDDILRGGLPPDRLYLLEGVPGAGKTTLALMFVLEAVRRNEPCLYVTLSETEEELRDSAASHGWSLDGVEVLELIPSDEQLQPEGTPTMFHPSEVELGETMRTVLEKAAEVKPTRMVFDSLSELRLLAESPLRYRRQVLALKQFFTRDNCTVLLIDDRIGNQRDLYLYSVAHGVICLESETAEYGTIRRRLSINKLRGRAYREGYHDFIIRRGGIELFPRLVAAEHTATFPRELEASGLKELDAVLGGGLLRGTSVLMLGAAGTGKSSLATQYICAAARDHHVAVFLFDESLRVFRERSAGLNMDVETLIVSGRLAVRQVDAAELSPGEFVHAVRRAVGEDQARMIVLDSLNGYMNAMPSDRYLSLHLHELLTYLGQQGVTTLMLMAQHGMVSETILSPVDASYLADTVILLRYFKAFGEVRKAISVIKHRTGKHERTVRELLIDDGLAIGEPLKEFQGVLSGTPQFMDNRHNS